MTRATKIHVVAGRNCNTRHVVPRGLTERRFAALMGAVFHCGRGSVDTRSLGWLAANGYVDVVGGSAYVTPWAYPLVTAAKRAGFYYWAGADVPSLVTDDGRHLDGYYAWAYVARREKGEAA